MDGAHEPLLLFVYEWSRHYRPAGGMLRLLSHLPYLTLRAGSSRVQLRPNLSTSVKSGKKAKGHQRNQRPRLKETVSNYIMIQDWCFMIIICDLCWIFSS